MVTVLWFTAEWCGPCKKMKPIVDKIASDTTRFIKLDIDTTEGRLHAAAYEVKSVPTFVRLDEHEEPVATVVGAHPEGKFRRDLGLEV